MTTASHARGTLYVVATPIGNLGDLSPRAVEVLRSVAAVCAEGFRAAGGVAHEASVIRFLAFDRDNPSSIINCIEIARRNARSVRTTLTTEMWEAVNQTSQELADFTGEAPLGADRLAEFLDWVKARVLLRRLLEP